MTQPVGFAGCKWQKWRQKRKSAFGWHVRTLHQAWHNNGVLPMSEIDREKYDYINIKDICHCAVAKIHCKAIDNYGLPLQACFLYP